jgi:hypothetical protein
MLPTITVDHIWSVIASNEKDYFVSAINKLAAEQPTLFKYIADVQTRCGERAALTGIIVYTLMKNAVEAQDLENP